VDTIQIIFGEKEEKNNFFHGKNKKHRGEFL
jgi:hypothetical protein